MNPFQKCSTELSMSRHFGSRAFAAIAALTMVLALARASEARIVYTPANVFCSMQRSCFGFPIDLNNDATNDFTISQTFVGFHDHNGHLCGYYAAVDVTPTQSGNGAGNGAHVGWAAALRAGHRIDSGLSFYPSRSIMFSVGSGTCVTNYGYGYWSYDKARYLGLEFQIQGQTHYGWARMEVGVEFLRGGAWTWSELGGYAYETIAGKSIKAGQKTGSDDATEPLGSRTQAGLQGRDFH